MNSDVTGYEKLEEPNIKTLSLLSFPVGIIAATILFFLAQALTSVHLDLDIFSGVYTFKIILIAIFGFVFFNVIIIIVHELLHALIFPEKLSSDNVIFGVYMASMFFAFYKLDMKRERMVFCMLFPTILLSILPMVIICILNINLPIINFLFLYHTTLAAGDMIGVYLILKGTPKNSYLKNKGYHTYYRSKLD